MPQYWLMKAEPDSRLEKGKDVAFSVDHFEKVQTTSWDGVRSREAKNIMKERMKEGDLVLFYHSNCKQPGVAAVAKISKEGYPDHTDTAWDPDHPYFDPKSDQNAPTWYMTDVTFQSRLKHFVALKLLQNLASLAEAPAELDYLDAKQLEAIKGMALLSRGRLSVQPVSETAFHAILLLGEKGGFDEWLKQKAKKKTKMAATEPDPGDLANAEAPVPTGSAKGRSRAKAQEDQQQDQEQKPKPAKRSRKAAK